MVMMMAVLNERGEHEGKYCGSRDGNQPVRALATPRKLTKRARGG